MAQTAIDPTLGMTPAISQASNAGFYGDGFGNLCRFPLVSGIAIEMPGISCVGPSYLTATNAIVATAATDKAAGLFGSAAGYPLTSPVLTQDGLAVCVASVSGTVHCVSLDLTTKIYDFFSVTNTAIGNAAAIIASPLSLSSSAAPPPALKDLSFTLISSPISIDAGGTIYFTTGSRAAAGFTPTATPPATPPFTLCAGFLYVLKSYKEMRSSDTLKFYAALPAGVMTSPVLDGRGNVYVLSTAGTVYQFSTASTGVAVPPMWSKQVCLSAAPSSQQAWTAASLTATPPTSATPPLFWGGWSATPTTSTSTQPASPPFPAPVIVTVGVTSYIAISCSGAGSINLIPVSNATSGLSLTAATSWTSPNQTTTPFATQTSATTCYATASAPGPTVFIYAGCTDGSLVALPISLSGSPLGFMAWYGGLDRVGSGSHPALLGDGRIAVAVSSANAPPAFVPLGAQPVPPVIDYSSAATSLILVFKNTSLPPSALAAPSAPAAPAASPSPSPSASKPAVLASPSPAASPPAAAIAGALTDNAATNNFFTAPVIAAFSIGGASFVLLAVMAVYVTHARSAVAAAKARSAFTVAKAGTSSDFSVDSPAYRTPARPTSPLGRAAPPGAAAVGALASSTAEGARASSTPLSSVPSAKWEHVVDADGVAFFHHLETGESVWRPPHGEHVA